MRPVRVARLPLILSSRQSINIPSVRHSLHACNHSQAPMVRRTQPWPSAIVQDRGPQGLTDMDSSATSLPTAPQSAPACVDLDSKCHSATDALLTGDEEPAPPHAGPHARDP